VCTLTEIKAVLQPRKLKIKFKSRAQPMSAKVKVALVRTTKAFVRGGCVDTKFHTYATPAVDGGVSSVSNPCRRTVGTHGLGVWVVPEPGRTLQRAEKSFLPLFELSFLLFPSAISRYRLRKGEGSQYLLIFLIPSANSHCMLCKRL